MAEPTTNHIRQQVSNFITSERAKSHSAVSSVRSLPVNDRYSRLIRAAAALHRAGTDSNYSLSEAQKKDCAAAAILIAEKNGVTPSAGEKYSHDDVKKFLDPKEMLANLTTLYINDAKTEKGTEEKDTRQAIEQDISAVYENEQAAKPAIAIAQAAPSKLPDSIVLAMSDDEFQQYSLTQDESEQERLNEARNKSENDNMGDDPDPNKAVNIQKNMDDPDWGHEKDDDDFKIEQGDIIEYLMKDVILASAAWVGNRAAGFVGTVSYELLSAGVKELHPIGRDFKDKSAAMRTDFEQYIKDCFSSKEPTSNPTNPENPSPAPQDKEQILSNLTGRYERNTAIFNAKIKAQQKIIEGSDALSKINRLHRQITKHFAVLGEDGITFSDGTTKPYSEYCGAGVNPETLKKGFKQLQENFDKIQINLMVKELGYENNPEKQKEVQEWYQKYTQTIDKGVKDKNPNISLPKEPKEFVRAFEHATQIQLAIYPHTRLLQAQTELFAEHYGRHRFLEELRKNPDSEIFNDAQKAEKFIVQQQQEAKIIFLTAEKARREGKTELNGQPLLSREGMIAEAEKLAQDSKKAIEQNETGPVQDTKIKPLVTTPRTSSETAETMMSEALKPDPSAQYAAYMHNLDLAEKEQVLKLDEISNRRTAAKDIRKKILQGTQNAENKGGVDIGKKYQQQGGRN